LYAHCAEFAVPHRRCGKIIVATQENQLGTLESYRKTAAANGVPPLRWLSQAEVSKLEPAVRSIGGLYSESTGIIDSHAYMESLVAELERRGGIVALRATLHHGASAGDAIRVETDTLSLDAEVVVNSAGLAAPQIAARLPHGQIVLPKPHYAKG